MKRIPRKLVVTLGIVLGLLLIVGLALRLFFPAEKVKVMAVNMASEKLGRDISVVDVGLSFTGGLGVKLGKVEVANPRGMSGEPLLLADNIDLKLKFSPLLRGEFRVHRLVIAEPRIQLVTKADGTNNFTFAGADGGDAGVPTGGSGGQEPPTDVVVSFDRLEIHQGRLVYHDEKTGQAVSLVGLNLTSGLTNPEPGRYQSTGLLEVDSLLVAAEKPLPALTGKLNYDLGFDAGVQTLDLTRGDLELNGFPLKVNGSLVTVPDSLRGAAQVVAQGIPMTDLLAFLTPEQLAPLEPYTLGGDVSGQADLDFDRTRSAAPLNYRGEAKVTELRAVHREVAGEVHVQEVRLKFEQDKLEVQTQGGTYTDQPLELTLTVKNFQEPWTEGSVSGTLDLASVEPFLPPERQASLSGLCHLEGWFSGGTADIAAMDYTGRARFENVAYADASLPDDLEQLNGTAHFDPQSITVEKAEARFSAGDLSLTGKLEGHLPYFLPAEKENRDSLPKPTARFEARSHLIDIDKLFPAAAPGAEGPGNGAASIPDTILNEAMPDLLCQGTIQADTLIYSRVPFTGVTGQVRMEDRILECYDVVGGVYGGQASGKVSIDLNDLNDPLYDGDFEATDVEANNFLTRFTDLSQVVFGKAGLKGSFQARGRDPDRLKSTLTMDSVGALTSGRVVTGEFVKSSLGSLAAQVGQKFDREQTLKDLTTLIKVEDGRVGLDQFKTKLGSFGDLNLGGSYGFAGDLEYQGSILLTKDQTARLYASGGLVGSVVSKLGADAERLNLPISVGGTMTSPKMNIDYSELTSNLQDQIQEEVTEGLVDEVENRLKGLFGK